MEGHLVLVGGGAGSTDDDAVEAVRSALAEAGPVEVATCEVPDDLDRALDRRGERRLVIAGGDGTIHLTVAALDRRGELGRTELGIVPLGTGNDLARTLQLPEDPGDAAQRIVTGAPRRLDLLRSSTGIVANATHAGVGVGASERATSMKPVLGPAAYPVGAVLAGAVAEPVRLRVEVDGEVLAEGEFTLVGVGNGRFVGGGTELFTDADPADGRLDVVIARDGDLTDRARLGRAVRAGEHPRLEGVLTARGRRVRISGTAAYSDDGELTDPLDGREILVEPAAWTVVC